MKCLSFTQPWATLIACGAKQWETRSWPLRLPKGTVIAIHASKTYPAWARQCVNAWPFNIALPAARDAGYCEPDGNLPLGKVIAIARYGGCRPTRDLTREWLASDDLWEQSQEQALGDYADGRYAYHFSAVAPIVPVVAKGALGIWEWTPPPEGWHDADVKGALEWFTEPSRVR